MPASSQTKGKSTAPMATGRPSRQAKDAANINLIQKKPRIALDDEESDNDAVSEPDEESGERVKATPRGAKSNKVASGKKTPPTAQTSGSGLKKSSGAKSGYQKDKNESDLYNALLSNKPQAEIDRWMARYDTASGTAAVAELMTLLVRCCGCKQKVTAEMLDTPADAMVALVQDFNEESDTYPLQNKSFATQFQRFIALWVKAAREERLQDGHILPMLVAWTTTLSSSTVRAFRHTGTYVSLSLCDELIDVLNTTNDNLAVQRRLLEVEAKSKVKKSSSKSRELESAVASLEHRSAALYEAVTDVFKGVVMHRYRDVSADIRQICVQHLGTWISTLPAVFLDDSYLKYVGWCLNDKHATVRAEALRALRRAFELKTLEDNADLFISRFKRRMVDMCDDVSVDVVCEAVAVSGQLARLAQLEPEYTDLIRELVFSNEPSIRRAAGEFLHTTCIDLDALSVLQEAEGLVSRPQLVLKYLFSAGAVMGKQVGTSKGSYMVDALWDFTEELQDWGTYLHLLTQTQGDSNDGTDEDLATSLALTAEEESLGFQFLAAASARAVGELQFSNKVAKVNATERKAYAGARAALTDAFLSELPGLLATYGIDDEKALSLLETFQSLDLGRYVGTSKGPAQFDATIKQFKALIFKTPSQEVAELGVASLNYVIDAESTVPTLATKVELLVSKAKDELMTSLHKFSKRGIPADEGDASYKIATSLNRLDAFASFFDISDIAVSTVLGEILGQGVDEDVAEDVLAAAIRLARSHLEWSTEAVDGIIEADNDPGDSLRELIHTRDSLVKLWDRLIVIGTESVQLEAFNGLMTVGTLFHPALANKYRDLALPFDQDRQDRIFEYIHATVLEPELAQFTRKRGANSKKERKRARGHVVDEDEDPLLECDVVDSTSTAEEIAESEAVLAEDAQRLDSLAVFCSAVTQGVLGPQYIGKVLPYMLSSSAVTALVSKTLASLRSNNPVACITAIHGGLEAMFSEEVSRPKDGHLNLGTMLQVASRIASSFGVGAGLQKDDIRSTCINIHRRGIDFAFKPENDEDANRLNPRSAPANIEYLMVVREFSSKLTKQDKTDPDDGVIAWLESTVRRYGLKPIRVGEYGAQWGAYHAFVANLNGTGTEKSKGSKHSKGQKRPASSSVKRDFSKRTSKKLEMPSETSGPRWGLIKKKTYSSDEDDEDEVSDVDDAEDIDDDDDADGDEIEHTQPNIKLDRQPSRNQRVIARGRRSGRRMARVTDDSLYSVDNEPEQLDEEDDDEAKGPFKLERFVCPQRTAFTDMSQQRTVNVVADLARFDAEVGRIALGPNATIYVTDRSGHRLLKFPASRPIVAGGGRGFEDSCSDQEDEALFNAPRGIVALSNGNVVVADMYNSAIREVSPSGEVSTLAGGENFGFKNGLARSAHLRYPSGVTVLCSGSIAVADSGDHRIRLVSSDGLSVTTLAGTGIRGFADGASVSAMFNVPFDCASCPDGSVAICDHYNHRIRMVSGDGSTVTTLAGSGVDETQDGVGEAAAIEFPVSISIGTTGRALVRQSNRVLRIIDLETKEVKTISGVMSNAGKLALRSLNAFSKTLFYIVVDADRLDSWGTKYEATIGRNGSIISVNMVGQIVTFSFDGLGDCFQPASQN